ncbi:MAG: BatD family protein [Prolixibacteraceae bacterium]
MAKKLLIVLFLLLPAIFAGADNVRFTMSAPNIVSAGQQFRLSFSLNEEGDDLQLPDLSGFEILMGPSVSQSSSIQIINGKTTQEFSFSYIFVLRAKQEGTFTIKPASIKVDGKVYQSNELTVQVVKGQVPAQQGASGSSQQQQQEERSSTTELKKEDLFVRTELDKHNVYKGEQIIATVKIYVSENVQPTGFEDLKLPSFEGFWSQDIETSGQISFTREVYNNKIYQVGVLKKTILFPQQTGKIRIDPFEITTLVRQQIRQQRSFFDDFFENFRTVSARVTSDPVTINVRDLPSPPEGFYGGVGNLKFAAEPDKTETRSNEAVTFRVSVSGGGNLRLIEAPKIEFPSDFEVYDPKTTDNLQVTNSGMSGTKTFDYLIIPRNAGNFTIPAVKFASFNPATGQYSVQSSPSYAIHVEKGDDSQNATVTSAYSKQDVRYIGRDIRYIKQNQYRLKAGSALFFGSTGYWLINLGALLTFLTVGFIYRRKLRENANIQLSRNKRANKVARRRLKEAHSFMKQNKAEEFYESVLRAYWGYLSDKLNIPVAGLSRENAADKLTARGVEQSVITDFTGLLDTCEFARYAPSSAGGTLEELYRNAAALMGKLEKQIR